MRSTVANISLLAVSLAAVGCSASATVTRTTPVANLQSHQTVLVRAAGISKAQQFINELADVTVAEVSKKCQFASVMPANMAGGQRPDLLIDLNIRQSFRGGTGLIKNYNKATVEVLVVLTDGATDELLGSATIRGESAAVSTSGSSPEGAAVGAVAKKIAEVLSKSGCMGPRVARTYPNDNQGGAGGGSDAAGAGGGNGGAGAGGDGVGTGAGGAGAVGGGVGGGGASTVVGGGGAAAVNKAKADALNNEGKNLFRAADLNGAIAKFEAAVVLFPDPRYHYNLCLSYETLKRYDDALTMCQTVLDKNPGKRLEAKATRRIGIIRTLKQKGR